MTEGPSQSLPPIDHIARELWKRGARDAAIDILRASVMRDPTARASAALLRAVEARPDASVSGPSVEIEMELVDAVAGQGMLLEARAMLRGTPLGRLADGQDRLARYDSVLARVPEELARVWHDAFAHVHLGAARHAISLIDREEANANFPPEWVVVRRTTLRELLSVTAVDRPSARPLGSTPPRVSIGMSPTEAMPTMQDEVTKVGKPNPSVRLPAVRDTQAALPATPYVDASDTTPGQPALRKRLPSNMQGGGYERSKGGSSSNLGTAPTSNMSLQEEAELLVRQGYPQQAVALYKAMLTQPNANPLIRQRVEELESEIAGGHTPIPNEVTVRHHDARLVLQSMRTDAMTAVNAADLVTKRSNPPASGLIQTRADSNAPVLVTRILLVG